jgi:hypothetical protein
VFSWIGALIELLKAIVGLFPGERERNESANKKEWSDARNRIDASFSGSAWWVRDNKPGSEDVGERGQIDKRP